MLRLAPVHFVALAACVWIACGGEDVRRLHLVRVAPAVAPECGAPDDALTLFVTALGDFPPTESTRRPLSDSTSFELDTFPAATRVLALEVLGAGGVTRTLGRTATFTVEDLEDDAELPVFMAPPLGLCPTGPTAGGRVRPLVAPAGDGALVAGGVDDTGAPVLRVELYNATTGEFEDLGEPLYGDEQTGLVGASVTRLPDGRIVFAGGGAPAYQIYDPTADGAGFSVAVFLPTDRSHHGAAALGGDRVLLAGGCSEVDTAGACETGSLLTTTTILDVGTGNTEAGPAITIPRVDGFAMLEADGRVLLIGGHDGSGAAITRAERVDPDGARPAEQVDGLAGMTARLAGDGFVTAFAPGESVSSAAASVLPPGATAAVPVASAPAPRAGATLTSLEDGRVVAIGGTGGAPADELVFYVADEARFRTVTSPGMQIPSRRDHAAVRLGDGTVLVVGGTDGGAALADAWIFRPNLAGPFSSGGTVLFGGAGAEQLLVPRDPARTRVEPAAGGDPARYVLESSGTGGTLPSEWAVVAGPSFTSLVALARIRVDDGGVALLSSFVGAGDYTAVVLIPGQAATMFRVVGGVAAVVPGCTGEVISGEQLAPGGGFTDAELHIERGAVTAVLGPVEARTVVLSCDAGELPRGLVGVGTVGPDGVDIELASLTVGR